MLLIITNKLDFSADFLILRLLEEAKGYFRLNSEDIPYLGYDIANTNNGFSGVISSTEREVDLSKVKAVWYRRMLWPVTSDRVIPNEQCSYANGELRHLIEGIVFNADAIWVNPIDSVYLAERKWLQLKIARDVGLRVPDSIASNDPIVLKSFIRQEGGEVVCKPFFHGRYSQGKDNYAVFAQLIKEKDLSNDRQLSVCPIFLQEKVKKIFDIRLTIIGDDVYPVKITSEYKDRALDWREDPSTLSYDYCKIDEDVTYKCKDLLRRMGLRYGAFDFAVSSKGEAFFLEVNAAGEWAWLEKELGMPMRASFVKLFYGNGNA